MLAWQVGRSGRRARLAHVLWVVFFIKLVTPPIVFLPIEVPAEWLPSQSITQSETPALLAEARQNLVTGLPSQSIADNTLDSVSFDSVDNVPFRFPSAATVWRTIALVWAMGFVFVVGRGVIRFVRFHRLLHREGKLDLEASAFVQKLLNQESLGRIRRGPDVLRIPIRVSPMLFGFGRRAVIVCPDQLWHSLSAADREAFLAHETAHYFRRDHWIRWLEWIVTAAYWWFPLVYIARNQLERHEEACCDSWAVRSLQSTPRSYAEALLRVVDFISENNVGLPRLASGMQPTDTLEERLRLVMRPSTCGASSFAQTFGCMACLSLWLVHPFPVPKTLIAEIESQEQELLATESINAEPSVIVPTTAELSLPDQPLGFWNQAPANKWAEFSLSLPGAKLIAEADGGISIRTPGRESLRFSTSEMSAIAEIRSTSRVVVGDRSGQVRIWDLSAGVPVSLIGRHTAPITSLAFHQTGGLVSADDGGSVMRWDPQSGQVLATWSSKRETSLLASAFKPAAIQSARFSEDGSMLAVLTGGWSDLDSRQRVHFVQSQSLETISSVSVQANTAVVVHSVDKGWVSIDWSGNVHSVGSETKIAKLEKHQVSALVFSHLAGRLALESVLN